MLAVSTKKFRTNVRADFPTPNRRIIYLRPLLERAIREFLTTDLRIGMFEFDAKGPSYELDARHISHHVDHVYIDHDGYMWIEVTFTDTNLGRLAALVPDLIEPSVVAIGFCGWDDTSNVVEEAALIHFNLAWKLNKPL